VAATATAVAVTAVVGGRSRGFVGGGRDPHRHSVLDGVCGITQFGQRAK
jgi:hypothetical protein